MGDLVHEAGDEVYWLRPRGRVRGAARPAGGPGDHHFQELSGRPVSTEDADENHHAEQRGDGPGRSMPSQEQFAILTIGLPRRSDASIAEHSKQPVA
ncbi:MAG: hypothetical protein ABJA98_32810 [Acidobacteriota bacterium]